MVPQISIIIPAYNSANYIQKCVLSALHQNGIETEILVVDDCSTDETADIMAALSAEHSTVHFARNATNMGAGNSRNAGLNMASHVKVAFLDSDDYWESWHLSKLHTALNADLNAIFSYGNYRFYNEKDGTYSPFSQVNVNHCFKDQLSSTLIATPSVLIDRSRSGPISFIERRTGQDYHMWLTLLQKGPAIGVDTRSITVTRRNNSLSKSKLQSLHDIFEIQTQYFGIGKAKALLHTFCYFTNAVLKYWRFSK